MLRQARPPIELQQANIAVIIVAVMVKITTHDVMFGQWLDRNNVVMHWVN